MKSPRKLILLLSILYNCFVFGQNSSIKGVIIDEKTGQSIPGATVSIKGLPKSQISNYDGNFTLYNVPAGTYTLKVSALSYKQKEVTEVLVAKNETTDITISLSDANYQLDEVVITTVKAKVESVKSLLTMQKNSATVSDGISAETIKRTPDKTTSDVLKRISGASIQDNRFVVIRGLNDRYNAAFLNGGSLPSSEPDRKAFSFDIFPSNMIDNLVITKTASPDLSGEFAGGIVQINTKAVPEKDFQSVSVGTGFNTITTFQNQKTYKGSATDWLGFDDGTRNIPATIPSTDVFNTLTIPEKAQVAKSFETDWAIKDNSFKPNQSFQYTIGRHFELKKNKVFGFLVSATNNVTSNFNETTRADYETPDPKKPSILLEKFKDNNYSVQSLTGGLANFSFKFNENHSLTFKNILSVNSTDLVVDRNGKKDVNDTREINANVRWFTSNRILSSQLNGEHYFSKSKIKLNWTYFLSDIKRTIPNLRRNLFTVANPNSTDSNETASYALIGNNNGGADYGGGMFFSENKEQIAGQKVDISKKINFSQEFTQDVKVGVFSQVRNRDFFSRQLQYNTYFENFDTTLLTQPESTLFSNQNMGSGIASGLNGFTLFDLTKPTDSYRAGSKLNAGYLLFDNRYKKLRLVWGLRFEDYTQTLDSRLTTLEKLNINTNQKSFLPSANFIYSLSKNQNLRFSFSKTLNRPEFRELAPFGFYDFTTQFFTQGNPELKTSRIDNYDFRYELYPGKGQLLSFSYFSKNFTDPIEIKQEINNKTVTYQNATSAKSSGIEIEFRTLLSSLIASESGNFLNDITLFSNLAIINSDVDVSNFKGVKSDKKRPMQGQSPYVFNAGLQYINKESGISISTNINRIGDRMAYASSEVNPAIWEKGRTFLDMQIAKSFYNNKLELKLNIQNILAQDLVFYQNNYRSVDREQSAFSVLTNQIFTGDYYNENGFDANVDDVVWITKYGRTFSLSMSYNF